MNFNMSVLVLEFSSDCMLAPLSLTAKSEWWKAGHEPFAGSARQGAYAMVQSPPLQVDANSTQGK